MSPIDGLTNGDLSTNHGWNSPVAPTAGHADPEVRQSANETGRRDVNSPAAVLGRLDLEASDPRPRARSQHRLEMRE